MTRWRQAWFPGAVLILLGIIGINLTAIARQRNASRPADQTAATSPSHDHSSHNSAESEPNHSSSAEGPQRSGMMGGGMRGGMMGGGMGRMGGGMMGDMPGMMADMRPIHALLDQHQKITRSVTNLDNGVEAVTESDDPQVARLITEHAWAMHERLKHKKPIRLGDPLFAAIFDHADEITLEITDTPKGVRIRETSDAPYVIKLIQSHGAAVSGFVKEGSAAMHRQHPVPKREDEPDAVPQTSTDTKD